MNGTWTLDKWISRYKIKTSVLLVTGVWLMVDSYLWATEFAVSSVRPGVEIAAIIAAVQGLATFYVGWIFKIYMEHRNDTSV